MGAKKGHHVALKRQSRMISLFGHKPSTYVILLVLTFIATRTLLSNHGVPNHDTDAVTLTERGRHRLSLGQTDVLLVIGTRPEAVKMAPLFHELMNRCVDPASKECMQPFVCVTGQHKDLIAQFLLEFSVPADVHLHTFARGQTLGQLSARIISGATEMLALIKPGIVLVQGDTTSALEVAYSAFLQHIPIGHVEAGLRTYDLQSPFPEEMNRQVIGTIATLHFAPTLTSVKALEQEGVNPNFIHQTGNTAIDSILKITSSPKGSTAITRHLRSSELKSLLPKVVTTPLNEGDLQSPRLILLTTHRRENHNGGHERIFQAALQVCKHYDNIRFVLPLHPNPVVKQAAEMLNGHNSCVLVVKPMGYGELAMIQKKSVIILTDSGGIQEEATALRTPVLVLRQDSERMEGVYAGVAKLVGSTSVDHIVQEVQDLLTNKDGIYTRMSQPKYPYGDGTAAQQIVDILVSAEVSTGTTNMNMKGRKFAKNDGV